MTERWKVRQGVTVGWLVMLDGEVVAVFSDWHDALLFARWKAIR